MTIHHGLRKIAFSHRISLLFFSCGVLPLALMLALFFSYLEKELKKQHIEHLGDHAKNIRAILYERLQMTENEIRFFLVPNGGPGNDLNPPSLASAGRIRPKCLESLYLLDRQGAVSLLGNPSQDGDIQFSELPPMESVKPAILRRKGSGGYPSLWMAVRASSSAWLVGRINPHYLWGEASDFNLPVNTELCVLDEEDHVLVASLAQPAHLVEAFSRLKENSLGSGFSWRDGQQDYIASARSLFLGGRFLADPWKIIISQPQEPLLFSIRQYQTYFLLIGFLMMLISLLLGQLSIRKSLRPLGQLLTHTRAVANEDFSGTLAIKGSPEFQELLEAFSDMSKKIEQKAAARTLELKRANEELSREVRQRIQAEDFLKEAKEAAERANLTKSEFLANMSHELRTPLNHIIGFTELVVDKNFGDLTAAQEESLQDVLGSSRHLLSLINDVLDLSKVEAGKMTLQEKEIPLRDLLEGSLVMIQEKASRHSIQISMDFGGFPEAIHADERKLKQILYNLLANAVKFTPDGGSIILSAQFISSHEGRWFCREGRPVALPPDAVSPLPDGNLILISVQDTGIGIEPGDLTRIFKPFEQGERSRSRHFQGTGLGLSLSKKMVELHGGKIWAESAGEGRGSKFIFIVPQNRETQASSAKDRSSLG